MQYVSLIPLVGILEIDDLSVPHDQEQEHIVPHRHALGVCPSLQSIHSPLALMSTTTLPRRAKANNALPLSYDTNTLGIVIYSSQAPPLHTLNAFFLSSSHRNGFSFIITTPIAPLSCNYPFTFSTLNTFIAKLQFI